MGQLFSDLLTVKKCPPRDKPCPACSCHGASSGAGMCTIPNQFCAKGTPGAEDSDYCCSADGWWMKGDSCLDDDD